MFKRIFIAGLIIVGLFVGTSSANNEFMPYYGKDADCFMTIGDSSDQDTSIWVYKERGPEFGRNYFKVNGSYWREHSTAREVVLPCCKRGSVSSVWACPEPETIMSVKEDTFVSEPTVVLTPKTFVVYFDFDKYNIREDQVVVLEEAKAYADKGKAIAITLISYCDFRGTNDYNDDLGYKRITSVENWFLDNGLETVSVYSLTNNGESMSVVKSVSKNGFCKGCISDRRVEITVE